MSSNQRPGTVTSLVYITFDTGRDTEQCPVLLIPARDEGLWQSMPV